MGIISAACKCQRKGESSYASGTIPPDDKNEHAWLRTSVSIPLTVIQCSHSFPIVPLFLFFYFFLSQPFILPAISKTREWMNGWINGRSLLLFVGCVIRINSDEENHRPTNNAISIILLEKYPIIFNIYICILVRVIHYERYKYPFIVFKGILLFQTTMVNLHGESLTD